MSAQAIDAARPVVPDAPRPIQASGVRYSTVAIVLHWAIAAGVVFQLLLGFRMQDFEGVAHAGFLQLHKSVGIAVLLLSVARLAWRRAKPPPAHGAELSPLERRLSGWVHAGFYGVMIGAPLTGWALVSMTRAGGPFRLFGAIPWARIPGLASVRGGANEQLAGLFDNAHLALVWLALGLLALHVLGALKHHFVSGDAVLGRMAPGARPGRLLQPWLIAIPLGVLGLLAAAYAPSPAAPPAPRPKVRRIEAADLYLDVVGPALTRRCESCHNPDTARGGLSVSSYDDLMAGGADGSVVVAGAPERSDLLRRVTLPSTHRQYMPKDGKTPLTPDQIAAIRYWITVGAPRSAVVGRLRPPAEVQSALRESLGLAGAEPTDAGRPDPDRPPPGLAAPEPAAVAALEGSGFVVRPIAQKSPLVDVDYYGARPLADADFANLARIGRQVRGLNLHGAGATDAALKIIGGFESLSILRLDGDPVTDTGMASLMGLKRLRVLNLYGTKVTDAGLQRVAALPSLRSVYVWGSAATPAGVAKVRQGRPDLRVFGEAVDLAAGGPPKTAPAAGR